MVLWGPDLDDERLRWELRMRGPDFTWGNKDGALGGLRGPQEARKRPDWGIPDFSHLSLSRSNPGPQKPHSSLLRQYPNPIMPPKASKRPAFDPPHTAGPTLASEGPVQGLLGPYLGLQPHLELPMPHLSHLRPIPAS